MIQLELATHYLRVCISLAAPADGTQTGTGLPAGFQGSDAAHDAQATAAEAAGINISASIAAASSSAAAVAATATANPNDPIPTSNFGLSPEQLGQLSGLRAKLAINNQLGDSGAAIQDQEDINTHIREQGKLHQILRGCYITVDRDGWPICRNIRKRVPRRHEHELSSILRAKLLHAGASMLIFEIDYFTACFGIFDVLWKN
ncbi:hypothetical protein C8R44DRAFT_741385 [Mycena epipterygia]|nr:hypothetical protein C8R44DRAFT_741385 [Mycena epipterygia]